MYGDDVTDAICASGCLTLVLADQYYDTPSGGSSSSPPPGAGAGAAGGSSKSDAHPSSRAGPWAPPLQPFTGGPVTGPGNDPRVICLGRMVVYAQVGEGRR